MKNIIQLIRGARDEQLDDTTLIERARQGDAKAFRVLYERHNGLVARVATRIMGSSPQVEDVVQETFIKAHGALAKFDTSRDFAPWIARIARNAAISRLRKRRDTIDLTQVRHLRGIDQWEKLEAREKLATFRAALDQLKPDAREAIVLHDVEGMTLAEIAELKGASINTIASRVRRARQKLADVMSPPRREERRAGGAS